MPEPPALIPVKWPNISAGGSKGSVETDRFGGLAALLVYDAAQRGKEFWDFVDFI